MSQRFDDDDDDDDDDVVVVVVAVAAAVLVVIFVVCCCCGGPLIVVLVAGTLRYVNLDDCWQDPSGRDAVSGKLRADPAKFPSGMSFGWKGELFE